MHPGGRFLTATVSTTNTRHLTEKRYVPTPACGTRTKRTPMLDSEPRRITCSRCAAVLLDMMRTPGALDYNEHQHAADTLLGWHPVAGSSHQSVGRDGIVWQLTSTPGGQRYVLELARPLPLEVVR